MEHHMLYVPLLRAVNSDFLQEILAAFLEWILAVLPSAGCGSYRKPLGNS